MEYDEYLSLYREMLRIRIVEEAIAERYAEQEIRCPVHLSVGQEAAAVGACAALELDDVIVSTHRCHGHYLAKGGSLDAMLGEIYGRVTGCCGGRGGSMHLFDTEAGVLASVPIVGSTIPLGVGAALAFQRQNVARVSMAFLGDAATEEGVFHESMNFASLRNLPVVFFVENNFYSVYTALQDRQPDRPLSAYAESHKMPSVVVDGNDVLAVRQVTKEMVARARSGNGPGLIIATTYRWREHCGPNYDNDLGYRTEGELEKWQQSCPLESYRSVLTKKDILDPDREFSIRSEIQHEIELSFSNAQEAPYPESSSAGERVYA